MGVVSTWMFHGNQMCAHAKEIEKMNTMQVSQVASGAVALTSVMFRSSVALVAGHDLYLGTSGVQAWAGFAC